jgi:hypothetical protein
MMMADATASMPSRAPRRMTLAAPANYLTSPGGTAVHTHPAILHAMQLRNSRVEGFRFHEVDFRRRVVGGTSVMLSDPGFR